MLKSTESLLKILDLNHEKLKYFIPSKLDKVIKDLVIENIIISLGCELKLAVTIDEIIEKDIHIELVKSSKLLSGVIILNEYIVGTDKKVINIIDTDSSSEYNCIG